MEVSGKDLFDIGRWDCRYPLGGEAAPHAFCGQPAQTDSAYCPEHHRRCHAGYVKEANQNADGEVT